MEFKNDHTTLSPSSSVNFSIPGLKLPNNQDVYFRAKQREIVDQYSAARVMLSETECSDWRHWYELSSTDNQTAHAAFQVQFKAIFYESALFYYNALVDLSWTLCYLCAEFSIQRGNERVEFKGMMPIDEASKLLRIAEGNVTTPRAETNPFGYLKQMCPAFSKAIDMVIDFWDEFSDSEIRKKYNYCKHKGKPLYSEISSFRGCRPIGFFLQNQGQRVELPVETRDVQWSISLNDSIAELHEFDDEKLFPYLSALIAELERIINPSPMVT